MAIVAPNFFPQNNFLSNLEKINHFTSINFLYLSKHLDFVYLFRHLHLILKVSFLPYLISCDRFWNVRFLLPGFTASLKTKQSFWFTLSFEKHWEAGFQAGAFHGVWKFSFLPITYNIVFTIATVFFFFFCLLTYIKQVV